MSPVSDSSVRWVSSCAHIPLELWAQCFVLPVEGLWWYAALEHSALETQFTFSYAILERHGEPVGIAPTFLMDVPLDLSLPPRLAAFVRLVGKVFPRVRWQRTLFVGSPCSDEGTVGLRSGVMLRDLAPLLHAALRTRAQEVGASLIVWKDFPEEHAAALELLCQRHGVFKSVSYPGTRLPLPAGGFEAYLQSLTASHRHNLRKKLRRSKALGDLVATVLQHPDASVLKEIAPLFEQTYQKGTVKFERLTTQFFERIAMLTESHFIVLRRPETHQLVAFMLCFRVGSRVINKFIGLDYSLGGSWFLYFRLMEAAITWASSLGALELQSGQTGYRAKCDLGHRLIPLTNYCHHVYPLVHHLLAFVARRISWSTLDADLRPYG